MLQNVQSESNSLKNHIALLNQISLIKCDFLRTGEKLYRLPTIASFLFSNLLYTPNEKKHAISMKSFTKKNK